jgi:hypothetical protein
MVIPPPLVVGYTGHRLSEFFHNFRESFGTGKQGDTDTHSKVTLHSWTELNWEGPGGHGTGPKPWWQRLHCLVCPKQFSKGHWLIT